MDTFFETSVVNGKGYIAVTEDLDTEKAGDALSIAFAELFESGHHTIVLDLSDVEIINSYGIGKILCCYKKIEAENGSLTIKSMSGFVKEVFELLMIDKLFTIEE